MSLPTTRKSFGKKVTIAENEYVNPPTEVTKERDFKTKSKFSIKLVYIGIFAVLILIYFLISESELEFNAETIVFFVIIGAVYLMLKKFGIGQSGDSHYDHLNSGEDLTSCSDDFSSGDDSD